MRQQMIRTVSNIIRSDDKTALLLVDIGVWGFKDVLNQYPQRALNVGIFESGMISVAAGMSLRGITPIIYGISPFIVERGLEQIKLDFCYQKVGGNFITVGSSYDFSKLGASHHCPGDVGILKMIPNLDIICPGTASQFDALFSKTYNNGKANYFRLSDYANKYDCEVEYGRAKVIKSGRKATIIAVSTMLDIVLDACENEDVTILYYTTISPFDKNSLVENCPSGKILLCEPYYSGGIATDILRTFADRQIQMDFLGVPNEFIVNYGKKQEHDINFGFTTENVKYKLEKLISQS